MFHSRHHKDSDATNEFSQQNEEHQTNAHSTAGNIHDPHGQHAASDPQFKTVGHGEHGQHSASSDPNMRGDYFPHSSAHDHGKHSQTGTDGYGFYDTSSHHPQGHTMMDPHHTKDPNEKQSTTSKVKDKVSSMATDAKDKIKEKTQAAKSKLKGKPSHDESTQHHTTLSHAP